VKSVPTQTSKRPGGLAALVGVAAAAALITFTPKQEGRELVTYCDGATENAQAGKVYTPAQCDAQLEYDLMRHAAGVNACVPMQNLTVGQRIAFTDMAFNVGVAGFCNSTMARLANQRDLLGSCLAMIEWVKISKYVKQPDGTTKRVLVPVKGLVLRRLRAIDICLTKA